MLKEMCLRICAAAQSYVLFTVSAARQLLSTTWIEDLGDAEFRHVYGLSRRLRFEDAARRARTTSDWWSTVYE